MHMKNIFNVKQKFFPGKVALLLFLSFVTVLTLGLSMGMRHSMGEMPKVNCIFDAVDGCDMTLNEHLSYWQQVFTANIFDLRIEFVLFAGLLFVFAFTGFFGRVLGFFRLWKLRPMLFYERRNLILNFLNPILRLLSAGVLQPKVYQSVDL